MKISIIIPAYNEEENIGRTVENLERVLKLEHELIIVDDHSTDSTNNISKNIALRYNNIKVVENKNDPGFTSAMATGFRNAATDIVIPVMADLCDDVKTIEKMYEKINEGYDVVCGSRYMKGGARLGSLGIKAFLSGLGGISLYYLLGIPTHDIPNAFKMYRKGVVDSIDDIQSKGLEFSMELALKAYYMGCKMTEVPTVWKERTKGESSFKVFKLLSRYIKLYIWAVFKRFTMRHVRSSWNGE